MNKSQNAINLRIEYIYAHINRIDENRIEYLNGLFE